MTRQGLMWSVAAVLGIVVTAAIAWSASLLAGQHIGLSSVPLSAMGTLAPASARSHRQIREPAVRRPRRAKPAVTTAVTVPTPPPAAPVAPPAAPAPPAATPAPPRTTSAPAPVGTNPSSPKPTRREDSSGSGPTGSGGGSNDSRKRDD